MESPQVPDLSKPATEYRSRLAGCEAAVSQTRRRHVALGYLRLLWAVLICVLAWFAFARHTVAVGWIVLPWLGFGATAIVHQRVLAAGKRASRAVAWYQHGLARLEDRWIGLHPRPTPPEAATSLYAADLDLFGPGSLFELLCTARTTLGQDRLAAWLLRQEAGVDTIRARQAAVAELGHRLKLRESVASTPGDDLVTLSSETLANWAEVQQPVLPTSLLFVAPVLTALALTTALWWGLGHSSVPFAVAAVLNTSLTYAFQRRLNALFAETAAVSSTFNTLAGIFACLEAEPFSSPLLQAQGASLSAGPEPASVACKRLARLSGANVLRNGLLRVLDLPLLYSLQIGLQMQRWRERNGSQVRSWLHALAEFEALLSLSAYQFEHPADIVPELIRADGTPVFSAGALAHPLLAESSAVRNDVALDDHTRLLLISGSNMSGKSTLMRAVGINTVLALAGGPVRARSLRLSPMQIGASIQINDSLQSGRSRFYAEILRLRAIRDLARTQPTLFLLDELLSGTNSQDRLAGASGLVRELLQSNAIGLLSTHDLALTGIGAPASERIRNMHFEDRIEGDRLVFDYTLREGVVTRSNGLDLMRLIGLDV